MLRAPGNNGPEYTTRKLGGRNKKESGDASSIIYCAGLCVLLVLFRGRCPHRGRNFRCAC